MEAPDPPRGELPHPQRVAVDRRGIVVTAHYRATEAGVSALRSGGNAVDAAVAAALALCVCEPAASGLGGQTMLLLHQAEPRKTMAVDGSSRAPHRATPGLLSARQRLRGHQATTVPSTPAVLDYVLRRYGRLTFPQVLEPAIELAREGFQVTELLRGLTRREIEDLRAGTAAPLLLREGRRAHPKGAILRQPVLAGTLERLAREGVEDFYTGGIAREIHRDMEAHGGILRDDDLAQIPWPIERRPISGRFAGQRVVSFPPPGAGRTLLEMLNVHEQLPESLKDPDTPDGAVVLAEVIRRGQVDRNDRPFDPDFYPQIPDRQLMDRNYARTVARQVRRRLKVEGETTHLSVMDAEGGVVALTQSIERVFGSCAASPRLGFLYNNYLSAFEYKDKSHPYYLRPNAVPWASVAPTIAFRGARPWLAAGSPGSARIVSSLLQVLVRLLKQSPMDAVNAPRMHCSLRGRVSLEGTRMRTDIQQALVRRGFTLDVRDPWSFYLGCVALAVRDRSGLMGVADPRRDGSAGGPSA